MVNYRVIVLSSKEPDNKFVGWLRPLEGSTNDMELLFYNNLSWKPIGSIGSMIYPAKITPLMDGVASIGVSKLYAREDHVHPSDDSKANIEDVYTKEEIIAINEEFLAKFETIDEAIQAIQSTLSGYQSEIDNLKESKQDKLVSGTNIKTINNESILGAGNISLLTLEEAKKNFIPLTSIGSPNGVASLNESGVIPSDQLPSYVDDVIEVYATYDKDAGGNLTNIKLYKDAEHSNIISTGESGKIYINVTEDEPSYNFRWSGTEFLYITTGGVVIGEITGTAYDGKKGKDTTDKLNTHVLDYNNPHKVTKAQVGLENVDNTSDLNKPISTATQNALDKKVGKIDICSHGTQTNPESTGSKFYRLINNKAFYIDNATGYVVIEIPVVNNPNYIFDILIIGGSREVGRLNINARVVSGEIYSIIANQFGLKEVIPVSAGLTQDGSKLAVLLGSSTWTVKTINVDISIGGQNSYAVTDTNTTISFVTDISSYKGIKTSNINTGEYGDIAGINNTQPYRDDKIFDKDPKSFNLSPGQSINVWGRFPEVGFGLLQIFRILDAASYKVIFFKHNSPDIYVREWYDSDSSTPLKLGEWEKILVLPINGTSAQFIKGDGSLDSNEYRPVVVNRSTTTSVISRRDFLYTSANTFNGTETGTLVIEIPLVTERIYEFEVILGSYRYYHKPTSLFFHLYRDKNVNPYNNCVCTKVGPLSYNDIRIAEKTDGQNFCILIGNVDSTWHHEIVRIPELVEDINYLDSVGLNIEATAYITTDESVFSKVGNIPTSQYYDPSSSSSSSVSLGANLWGNKLETGNENFSDKSLFIKGSTDGTWAKGLYINKTGDTSTSGAFLGAYGPNTGIPSHLCLGWAYNQASMIINLSSKKVALGVNLTPTNDYYNEDVNIVGSLGTTGKHILRPTLSGTWETGVYAKGYSENIPLVSVKGNERFHQLFTFGSYITQNLPLGVTKISSDLTVTGDLTANKASSTEGFFETSDERVKDFKESIEVDLEKLSKLSKKYFSFKRTPDKLNIGVSAQEIKEIYPEIVSESSSGILSVDYSKLSVIALAAIDKLYDRIVEIEKRLNNEY